MRLTQRVGAWLLAWGAARRAQGGADEVLAHRRALARRQGEIARAVGLVAGDAQRARRLARLYLAALWERECDAAWWRENAEYVAQPWFVQAYASAQGWLAAPEPPQVEYYALRPEGEARGGALMRVEREAGAPAQGEISIEADNLPGELVRSLALRRGDCGAYARSVGEAQGDILERAVETGAALLEAGYTVTVCERALRDRIAQGSFEPMHEYWITEAERPDALYISYPWDARLHGYVRDAGGRWNGQRMEIAVSRADALEELALRYGFRFTKEARRRLDAWREAVRRATIYRKSRKKPDASALRDEFIDLLSRPIRVPEDLKDE